MLAGPGGEIDAGAPRLVQGVGRGRDHPGEELDAFQLAERDRRQDGLDRAAQALVIDSPSEPAGEANRQLLERHDLEALLAVARGLET